MTYDFQNLNDLDESQESSNMGEKMSKGIKFDGKNHNWLVFNEYMSLPFCYLTFVIKDKIESNCPDVVSNEFDMEPWNCLFNKCTSFLSDSTIAFEHQQLSRVLLNFHKINPELLEILYYTQRLKPISDKNHKQM